jgi:hypothetical protein
VSSFILAFFSYTQSKLLESGKNEMTNSLAISYYSSSLGSTITLECKVPTVQDTSISRILMPAFAKARLMQFMTALFALPSF